MYHQLGVIILYEGAEISLVSDSDCDDTVFALDSVEAIPVEGVDSLTGVSVYILNDGNHTIGINYILTGWDGFCI